MSGCIHYVVSTNHGAQLRITVYPDQQWGKNRQERAWKAGQERAGCGEKPDRNGLGVGKSRTGTGWEWGEAG